MAEPPAIERLRRWLPRLARDAERLRRLAYALGRAERLIDPDIRGMVGLPVRDKDAWQALGELVAALEPVAEPSGDAVLERKIDPGWIEEHPRISLMPCRDREDLLGG
jgi:hypothetical protein